MALLIQILKDKHFPTCKTTTTKWFISKTI